jgi:hypothetical protein
MSYLMEDSFFCFPAESRPVVAAESNGRIPRMWLGSSVQSAAGLFIPYLPEPRTAEAGRSTRSEVFSRQVIGFSRAFQKVVQLLSEPHVRRDSAAIERNSPFWTFDLRICGGSLPGSRIGRESFGNELPEPPRLAILIKGVMETGIGTEASSFSLGLLQERLSDLVARFRAIAPTDLTTLPICWSSEGPLVTIQDNRAIIRPECLGLGPGFNYSAEIRKSLAAGLSHRFSTIADYRSFVDSNSSATIPVSWPESSPDLLSTCTALLSHKSSTILSIRVHPSRLTNSEASAFRNRLEKISKSKSSVDEVATATLEMLLRQRDLFQCVVQVSSESKAAVSAVTQAFIAEHVLSGSRSNVEHESRRLSAVHAIIPEESTVAEYNLRNLEMLPWGCSWPEALASSQPASNSPLNFEQSFLNPENGELSTVAIKPKSHAAPSDIQRLLGLPDMFLERDAEGEPEFCRMRYLFSTGELLSVWRLPVVPPGGHQGLQSRYPNPFEQFPEPTPVNGDCISLGRIQMRGLDTNTEFRVPFDRRTDGVAGVGDRSIVVAGSPGSGKTNFCLSFLQQLWPFVNDGGNGKARDKRTPYLVIDPTRGNEFRALVDSIDKNGSEDVLLFTVGDPRCSPFCFNPFQVPRKVSVQSHISRLMSCFRSAYEMWDPLPAIFEMALRLAYEGIRSKWWESRPESHGRTWTAAIDFAQGLPDEPFPVLSDVVLAMGKGEPNEKFHGRPSIMVQQKEMWGGQTENAHTIVASTYLRLRNLSDNYDTIIGGPASGRPCIDLCKLMEKPAILEFGMVGDSQALALIMSFLVCALAGTIEGRENPQDNKHFLVLEEAHRLLAGDHGSGKQGSNSKAQAAEDINTMLAEVRKYGQGVMIIDQRPGSLVGGVIDNAYLVAMHRLNEEKGFKQFVQQLNLNADQQRYVRSELRPGQMVTLDRRSGLPVLVRPKNLDTDAKKMHDENLRLLMSDRVRRVLADDISFSHLQKGGSNSVTVEVGTVDLPDLKRTGVIRRPYEDQLLRTIQDILDSDDREHQEKSAIYLLKEADRVASVFDKTLKEVPPGDRWIKVVEEIVNRNELQANTLEIVKSLVEQTNGRNAE